MANWLQGWRYDSQSSSSGLTPPTEKQVTDAGLLYATWMFPMTRMGSAVTGWLVRQWAKRIVPPSGLSLAKTTLLTNTPAGAIYQMGKGTFYRILGRKAGLYNPMSKSSEGSSPSYQQNGSSGGKPNGFQETVKPVTDQRTLNRMIKKLTNSADRSFYKRRQCPPGYSLKKIKRRWMCVKDRK